MPTYTWVLLGGWPSGSVLPGEIDTIKTLVEDPEMGDLSIQVRQIQPTSGGRDAALDALGSDRGITRNENESDEKYRARIGALPDTITAAAVNRACSRFLEPYQALDFTIIETFEVSYQTCWDSPTDAVPLSAFSPYLFKYDDPDLDGVPFRNRWLDETDYRGGFIVWVPNLQPISDAGMQLYPDPTTYEDLAGQVGALATLAASGVYQRVRVGGLTGMVSGSVGRFLTLAGAAESANNGTFLIVNFVDSATVDIQHASAVLPDGNSGSILWQEQERVVEDADPAAHGSALLDGKRAPSVYDSPDNLALLGYQPGVFDGYDSARAAVYKGLHDTIQSIKAAGISAALELRGQ